MNPFDPIALGSITLKNRILRSATYEGLCDDRGFPTEDYVSYLENIAKNEVGGLITGFVFTSPEGRAMQPAQGGIDEDAKIPCFSGLTEKIHKHHCAVFLQLSHCGRQSLSRMTPGRLRGVSGIKSWYFRETPIPLATQEVYDRIEEFAHAAKRAQMAGFDGIQLHAAHGYLIHQFLLPSVNNRDDEFGIDPNTGIGQSFLEKIIIAARKQCGMEYPILVKISSGATGHPSFGLKEFDALIKCLDAMQVTAIEVSFGTMDYPLNIFRGDFPEKLILKENPIVHAKNPIQKMISKLIIRYWYLPRHIPFTPTYNLEYAKRAKSLTTIPVISVGGFRSGKEIFDALANKNADMVGLSRPLIAEPDFLVRLKNDSSHISACCNCNYCAIMCDNGKPTKCYSKPLTQKP